MELRALSLPVCPESPPMGELQDSQFTYQEPKVYRSENLGPSERARLGLSSSDLSLTLSQESSERAARGGDAGACNPGTEEAGAGGLL